MGTRVSLCKIIRKGFASLPQEQVLTAGPTSFSRGRAEGHSGITANALDNKAGAERVHAALAAAQRTGVAAAPRVAAKDGLALLLELARSGSG